MGVSEALFNIAKTLVLRPLATFLTTPDDLHILTIALDLEADAPRIVFRLEINQQFRSATPKTIKDWAFPLDTFKIPNELTPGKQEFELNIELPSDLVTTLRETLPENTEVPLWLAFGAVAGYLRLVPWDSLFHKALDRPILRMIDLESPPARELDSVLDVVICASEPRAKSDFRVVEVLPRMVESILATQARETITVHIFADADKYNALCAKFANDSHVKVYLPPEDLASKSATPRGKNPASPISNAWLRWICAELKQAVDVVHFVCHGYLASDQGWLAVAESPTQNIDEVWARFIGSAELDKFLVQCGAWSVVFTSPPGNFSQTGLRLLANQIFEDGRRPAVIHGLAEDESCAQLAQAYKFLYQRDNAFAPSGSALSIYCHPALVKVGTPAGRLVTAVASRFPDEFGFTISEGVTDSAADELNEALRKLKDGGGIPPWLVTTQRYIEQRRLELRRLERESGGSSEDQRRQIEDARTVLTTMEQKAVRLAKATGDAA